MSVLDKKLRRELLAARGMLGAIVGIIVIGISSFVSMASIYYNLDQSRRSYYAQCRMADFSVELKKLPLSELDRLDGIGGISEIRPRIRFNATVDLEGVVKPLSGLVLSLPEQQAPVINDIILRGGGYFTARRREEVIVNDAFARARHIKPGDVIHLLLNNQRQELFVVGTAISSEFVYLLPPGGLIPDPESYGVFYIKQRFAEEVFDFEGACNQLVGLLSPSRRDKPEEILSQIETRLEPFGVATTTPRSRQPSHWFLSNEIKELWHTTTILPTIFLAVAALILNVLMTRMAEQQRTVVGTLKALGYSNRELFRHFLKFSGAVGVVGGVLGSVLGYVFAGVMTDAYRPFFEFPEFFNRPYPLVMLAGVGISMGFAVFGALRGVRIVVRLAPAEAMRPRPPRRGRSIGLERWRWFWKSLDFRWHMVLRSVFRNRVRTLVGVLAGAIGAAMMLVTFFFRDAVNELVAFQFDKLLLADYELALNEDRDYGALLEARDLPGVDHAEPVFVVPCKFRHGHREKQGAVTGLVPAARLTVPRNIDGNRVAVPKDGLLITQKLADILAVQPGDTVTVVPVKGMREPFDVPVTSIVDSYLGLAAYADFGYLNRVVGEEGAVSSLQLKLQPGSAQTQAFYRELKQLPTVQAITAVRDQKAKLTVIIVDRMKISIFVLVSFAGMIFFGSILNSSLISLSERRQEIATMRVLGYTSREIGVLFLRESVCLNVAGTLLGLPLGYWMSRALVNVYNYELFRMPFVIRPESWVTTVVLGLGFVLVSHLPVQRAINRLNWLRELNVKE